MRKALKLWTMHTLHSSTAEEIVSESTEGKEYVVLYEVLQSRFAEAHMESSSCVAA